MATPEGGEELDTRAEAGIGGGGKEGTQTPSTRGQIDPNGCKAPMKRKKKEEEEEEEKEKVKDPNHLC